MIDFEAGWRSKHDYEVARRQQNADALVDFLRVGALCQTVADLLNTLVAK